MMQIIKLVKYYYLLASLIIKKLRKLGEEIKELKEKIDPQKQKLKMYM